MGLTVPSLLDGRAGLLAPWVPPIDWRDLRGVFLFWLQHPRRTLVGAWASEVLARASFPMPDGRPGVLALTEETSLVLRLASGRNLATKAPLSPIRE